MALSTLDKVIKALADYEIKITVNNDNQVFPRMYEKLNEYCEIIGKLDFNIYIKALDLKDNLINCFKLYMNGNLYESTKKMNEIIGKYLKDLYIHNMNFHTTENINIYHRSNEYLYKGAVKDWTNNLDREYILHIPFSKREKVKTQRFSIPGVPCLYLGQSLYIIWEELNRPSFDNFFVSRFKLKESTKVLDLGLNIIDLMISKALYKTENTTIKETIYNVIKKFIFTNVLKIACLIHVKQTNRDFKSEYVIPQLLLMSLTNLKFAEGIRYSSVKVKHDSYIYANYAFPAIQDDECSTNRFSDKLIEIVELTKPINLGLYSYTNRFMESYKSENLLRDSATFNIDGEYEVKYKDTEFFNLEQKIANDTRLKFEKVQQIGDIF